MIILSQFSLILHKNIHSGYSLEVVLTSIHNVCFMRNYPRSVTSYSSIPNPLLWKDVMCVSRDISGSRGGTYFNSTG